MNPANKKFLFRMIISIFFISFLTVGGCDIEFGGGGGNNGGGGNGGNNDEIVNGTIVDIIPETSIEGITVEIDDNGIIFSDVTGSSGFFQITNRFSGTLLLQFFDGDTSLALTQIEVFPTASLDLGNVTIENGNVNFDPSDPDVTFEGNITENNCSDNTGTLIVEAKQGSDETDVLVQVTASTDIERSNGDEVLCENLLVGQTVEVRGDQLPGNTVDAIRVELQ